MRTEPNYDAHITQEPKEAKIVGFCGGCLHDIQEGDKAECACGVIVHDHCLLRCALCVRKGCALCVQYFTDVDDRICGECRDRLNEERKNFVSNVGVLIATALTGLDYNVSRPFRQETDKATVLEFITSGKLPIEVHIGKDITE